MNIHSISSLIPQKEREKLNNHHSIVIWFTGLSGAGKSSISQKLELLMFDNKIRCFILDGDNIRAGLNSDLGFSLKERSENIRRIAEVAKLFMQSGQVVIVSFISPLEKDRKIARGIIGKDNFYEVYVNTPLETCQERDPKGLYKKVKNGEIKKFTGIDSPYEEPKKPNLILSTKNKTIQENAKELFSHVLPLLKIKT